MTYLLVPMVLRALVLERTHAAVEARADFTRLPWFDGQVVRNPDVANLSASVLARPFEDQQLYLKPGVHLHWQLPAGLRRGTSDAGGTRFPAVPNRWWITRHPASSSEPDSWIVESNYLWPEGAASEANLLNAVSIPNPDLFTQTSPFPRVDLGPGYETPQPFRLLGRALPAEGWTEQESSSTAAAGASYLPGLTAAGYGDPTFAAFYPNCHSVFGLCDGEADPASLENVVYTVLGWYSLPEDDPVASSETGSSSTSSSTTSEDEDWWAALEERFGWNVPGTSSRAVAKPDGLLCYGQLTFTTDVKGDAVADPPSLAEGGIAIGNTGTEALSAWLASEVAESGASSDRLYQLEEQIEAAELASALQGKTVDLQAALRDARHEQAFTAAAGGTVWSVEPRTETAAASSDRSSETAGKTTLPPALAAELNELNLLQRQYDRATAEIAVRRRQLYADWCKYMLCAYPPPDDRDDYPDIDEVRYFIESRDLGAVPPEVRFSGEAPEWAVPLDVLIAETGDLQLPPDGSASSASESGNAASLAARVLAAAEALGTALPAGLDLRAGPAASFWQPAEPVVLVVGDAAGSSDPDARELQCSLEEVAGPIAASDGLTSSASAVARAVGAVTRAASSSGEDRFDGIQTWSAQPWNPFLLQWTVELFPAAAGGNRGGAYDPTFVSRNYDLEQGDADLSLSGTPETAPGANIYTGESILTPYAAERLASQFEALLGDGSSESSDARADLIAAEKKLHETGFHCLSQALGGFNAALLMHQQVMQLALAEPLGFPAEKGDPTSYRDFTEQVAGAVGIESKTSPLPLNDFNPIRSGEMRLLGLRLVDSFGRVRDLVVENGIDLDVADRGRLVSAETLPLSRPAPAPVVEPVTLPPRLVQPARLAFDWLSAPGSGSSSATGADLVELTSHPAASPVCGWLLPDHLDGSLAVYDAAGGALGSVTGEGWRPSPGPGGLSSESRIGDPCLEGVVSHLDGLATRSEGRPLGDYLSLLETAQDAIQPPTTASRQALSVLIGRPLAVVRVRLGLELQGPPAADQGWNAFRLELQGHGPRTDGFENVRFPVVLGADARLGDGLVGFWLESDGSTGPSFASPPFHSPYLIGDPGSGESPYRSGASSEDGLVVAPPRLELTAAGEPVTLTLLIDPHAAVHVTSGILPVVSLALPPDQVAAALRRLSIDFLTAPVLDPPPATWAAGASSSSSAAAAKGGPATAAAAVLDVQPAPALTLPAEPGYAWSWLERDADDWWALTDFRKPDTRAAFAGTPVLREGWLQLSPEETPE